MKTWFGNIDRTSNWEKLSEQDRAEISAQTSKLSIAPTLFWRNLEDEAENCKWRSVAEAALWRDCVLAMLPRTSHDIEKTADRMVEAYRERLGGSPANPVRRWTNMQGHTIRSNFKELTKESQREILKQWGSGNPGMLGCFWYLEGDGPPTEKDYAIPK